MITVIVLAALTLCQQGDERTVDALASDIVKRFENCKASGLHRVIIGEAGAMVVPALPEDGKSAYWALRREEEWGRIQYNLVALIDNPLLTRLKEGQPIEGLRSGDLLQSLDSPPKIGIRVAGNRDIPSVFTHLFERTLSSSLSSSGLYLCADIGALWSSREALIDRGLPEMRAAMREHEIDAVLNLIIDHQGGRLIAVCQIIAREQTSDEVFSLSVPLTADLSLLLQRGPRVFPVERGQAVLSSPAPQNVLDIHAANIDRRQGDELLVLTSAELRIYKINDYTLSLDRQVSLDEIHPAEYPTRSPTGKIVSADIDRDGRLEVLLSCNLWSSGALVKLSRRTSITPLPLQPLAVIKGPEGLRIAGGHYRAGEDTFQEQILAADSEFASLRVFSTPGFRSIHGLDNTGSIFMLVYPEGGAGIWDRSDSEQPKPYGLVFPGISATAPRFYPGLILFSQSWERGDLINAADFTSPTPTGTGILTFLDIAAIVPIELPSSNGLALACYGRGADGTMRLEIYLWPLDLLRE